MIPHCLVSYRSCVVVQSSRGSVNVIIHKLMKQHIRSFHSIHNVVDRGVPQAMWEELAGKVGH